MTYDQFSLTDEGRSFLESPSLDEGAPAMKEILESIAAQSNLPIDNEEVDFLEILRRSKLITRSKE